MIEFEYTHWDGARDYMQASDLATGLRSIARVGGTLVSWMEI